jgi:hypothetical protein
MSKHTEKTKLKISRSLRRAYKAGTITPSKGMAGKSHSPETIARMRDAAQRRISLFPHTKPSNAGHQHSIEARQKMSVAKKGKFVGETSPLWKGDRVGYGGIHAWIVSVKGKPMSCEDCLTTAAKAYHWANISGEYKRDANDWKRLCARCHHRFDLKRHPRDPRNARWITV